MILYMMIQDFIGWLMTLSICLGIVYLTKTKSFFTESYVDKAKK